jgi:hypothetical protein
MTSAKKKIYTPDKEYKRLLDFYIDLNKRVFNDFFLYSILSPEDTPNSWQNDYKHERNPILIGQMGTLYSLCPLRYHEVLNKKLLDFLGENFRHNVVFILNNDGFMLYIMIMQTNVAERTAISRFFANHYDDLSKYQYFTSEYDPKLEKYKLLIAKPKLDTIDEPKDIVLTFF